MYRDGIHFVYHCTQYGRFWVPITSLLGRPFCTWTTTNSALPCYRVNVIETTSIHRIAILQESLYVPLDSYHPCKIFTETYIYWLNDCRYSSLVDHDGKMKPIEWSRRTCMVAIVYMWVACLLCNGVLVEDTKAPETAVPTLQHSGSSSERRRGRQRDSSKPTVAGEERTITTGSNYGGSGVYDPDDLQMGCTELRSKRYISDGFCTSMKPITEVVCAGECLPIDNGQLPFYAQYLKVWSREKTREYRCVNDVVRQKRVHLICDNNERRTYRIRTVRSCKCKRYNREHNKSQLYDNISNKQNTRGARSHTGTSSKSAERESSRDERRRARQSKSDRTRA